MFNTKTSVFEAHRWSITSDVCVLVGEIQIKRTKITVLFQSIRPSRVTGLVVLAEIRPLSQVTQSLANFKKKMAINRCNFFFLGYMALNTLTRTQTKFGHGRNFWCVLCHTPHGRDYNFGQHVTRHTVGRIDWNGTVSLVNTREERVRNPLRPIVPLLPEPIPKRCVLLWHSCHCKIEG